MSSPKMMKPQETQEELQANDVKEESVNYESMTIAEIKAILDEKGIKYTSKMNKTELIELLSE